MIVSKAHAVTFEKTCAGWRAYVRDLPGVAVVARTRYQLARRMERALRLHLRGMRADRVRYALPHALHVRGTLNS